MGALRVLLGVIPFKTQRQTFSNNPKSAIFIFTSQRPTRTYPASFDLACTALWIDSGWNVCASMESRTSDLLYTVCIKTFRIKSSNAQWHKCEKWPRNSSEYQIYLKYFISHIKHLVIFCIFFIFYFFYFWIVSFLALVAWKRTA